MPRKSRKETAIANVIVPQQAIYKVGLYTRLSVEDIRKKESDSIGTQAALLRQYITEQPDMVEVAVYQDTDKTGTNFNRPGFNKLLEDIRAKNVNCIVVKDLSRFGRNHIETGNYLERVFPFMGVRFVAIGDGYDSNAPTSGDELIMPLKNLVNEIYAKEISKKTRLQYEVKRQRGDFCGAFAPYGYIKQGNALIVDEVAAEVVKRIFTLVLDGYSDNAITAMLNNDNILPPNRHKYEQGLLKGDKHSKCKYWYKSVVKRITENSSYLGNLEQGRYKTGFMNNGKLQHLPKSEWTISANTHPAIIDEEIFLAVQELRTSRTANYNKTARKANRPKASDNIFKGLVYCNNCGRPLSRMKVVRASGELDYRYLCPTYQEVDMQKCTKKNLLESELLPAIHAFINLQIQMLTDINLLIESISKQANYATKMEQVDCTLAKVKQDLTKVAGLRSGLYEDFKEGLLSRDDYKLAKAKYESRQEDLAEQIKFLSSQRSKRKDIVRENKWALAFKEFSAKKKLTHELVTSIIERIDVDSNNNINITVKYRDEQVALLQNITEYNEEMAV